MCRSLYDSEILQREGGMKAIENFLKMKQELLELFTEEELKEELKRRESNTYHLEKAVQHVHLQRARLRMPEDQSRSVTHWGNGQMSYQSEKITLEARS